MGKGKPVKEPTYVAGGRTEGLSREQAKMIEPCRGCFYLSIYSYCCDYMLLTGQRRPCKPGKGCTVKKVISKVRRVDYGELMKHYRKGMSDLEIAQAVGCSKSTVYIWRKRYKLPPASQMLATK